MSKPEELRSPWRISAQDTENDNRYTPYMNIVWSNENAQTKDDSAYVVKQSPWIYRACTKWERSIFKDILNIALIGGMGLFAGHKYDQYKINQFVKQNFVNAEASYAAHGYVTFSEGGVPMVEKGVIEEYPQGQQMNPEIEKVNLEEAKKQIVTMSKQNSNDVSSALKLGVIGSVVGYIGLGALIGLGAKRDEKFEWDEQMKKKILDNKPVFE